MRLWLAALSIALASSCVVAQDRDDDSSRYAPTPAVSYPDGVRSLRDVTYAELSGFRPLTLDLYLPPDARKAPAVVFVHGGAFRHRTARDGGTFRDFPAALASVAARGYVVASVNYRLAGEARFPGPVQDVGLALHWLREHAADYGLDAGRIVLWGSSAGGQIAALIGTACGTPLAPECVQGVIDWYGIIDLESNPVELGRADAPEAYAIQSAYLGCNPAQCPPGLARSASALAYIDASDPPFLIQHGAADTTVSPRQSQRLHAALRAAGVDAELDLYPNVAHGFAKSPGGGPDDAVNRRALARVCEFLERRFPVRPLTAP